MTLRTKRVRTLWICTGLAAACATLSIASNLRYICWAPHYRHALILHRGVIQYDYDGDDYSLANPSPSDVGPRPVWDNRPRMVVMTTPDLFPTAGWYDDFGYARLPLWMPFALCAGIAFWSWRDIRKRARTDRCFTCGYPLASPDHDDPAPQRCSECGALFTGSHWDEHPTS